ncbi:MAG: monovalent cation/H+ antiporter subunit A, partial [Gammaproteobacteria bacterium HGW-Gammaproteobacteria-14]
SVAYSVRFVKDVFFGVAPPALQAHAPHEPPRFMRVPVELLVVLCLAVGVVPALLVGPLLAASAGATLGGPLPEYSLAIWHGLNLPLAMSVVALVGGVLLYRFRAPLFAMQRGWPRPHAPGVFELAVQQLVRCAGWAMTHLDKRALQNYMGWLMFAVALILVVAVLDLPGFPNMQALTPVDGLSVLMTAVAVAAAVGATLKRFTRLIALMLIAVVGLVVSLAFLRLSAPDLALTQLSVEVVAVLLLMLVMHYLPVKGTNVSGRWELFRDRVLAWVIGSGVGVLSLYVMLQPGQTISGFFIENSVPGGGGSNVVNVILVDFRGFDTLGEITVLAIAAMGIYALLKGLKLPQPDHDPAGRPWTRDRHPLVLTTISRSLLPMALLVALYILVRGHNLPGGGFIAGLVTAIALTLQYVAHSVPWMHQRVPNNYHPLVAIGVLIAGLTGLASMLLGYPFLTSTFSHVHWPLVGEFELASAMLFDIGVYLTVVGSVLLILANLGRLAETGEAR